MQIDISARHGQLNEKTQEKISSKVERLLRHFDRVASIEVTVDLENRESPKVDIRLNAEHKHDFLATVQGELMGAIDGAVHKLEQQIRKYKDKIQSHHRTSRRQDNVPSGEGEDSVEQSENT